MDSKTTNTEKERREKGLTWSNNKLVTLAHPAPLVCIDPVKGKHRPKAQFGMIYTNYSPRTLHKTFVWSIRKQVQEIAVVGKVVSLTLARRCEKECPTIELS